MRVAIDAVLSGKLPKARCATPATSSTRPRQVFADYYVKMAKELKAGCHIIAIKDMAGLLKPAAAPGW